jgi:DNA-binding LacI/PurR family transcriptional regulator
VQERRLAEYCTHLSADGVLLVLSSETTDLSHLDVLRECGIPVVLLDRTIETTKHSTVTIDDHEAGREAGAYLLDKGHSKCIGVFGDQRQRISALRLKGFRRAYTERGLAIADSQLLRVTLLSELEEQLNGAFQEHPDVSAIFTMTDELLVHTHHLLMRRGIRIPEEVSLLAISDGAAPSFLHPNVTHFRHAGVEVGERTAHFLIGLIEHNSDAVMDVRIRTTLVEMGSVSTRTAAGARKRAIPTTA